MDIQDYTKDALKSSDMAVREINNPDQDDAIEILTMASMVLDQDFMSAFAQDIEEMDASVSGDEGPVSNAPDAVQDSIEVIRDAHIMFSSMSYLLYYALSLSERDLVHSKGFETAQTAQMKDMSESDLLDQAYDSLYDFRHILKKHQPYFFREHRSLIEVFASNPEDVRAFVMIACKFTDIVWHRGVMGFIILLTLYRGFSYTDYVCRDIVKVNTKNNI